MTTYRISNQNHIVYQAILNKWKWKSESEVTYGQVLWPILGICALHLTHPRCTHTHTHTVNTHPEQWAACGTRGAVEGLVSCSRAPQSWYWGWRERAVDSLHQQFLPGRDSNSQPLHHESDSLTIRPWLHPNRKVSTTKHQKMISMMQWKESYKTLWIKKKQCLCLKWKRPQTTDYW